MCLAVMEFIIFMVHNLSSVPTQLRDIVHSVRNSGSPRGKGKVGMDTDGEAYYKGDKSKMIGFLPS